MAIESSDADNNRAGQSNTTPNKPIFLSNNFYNYRNSKLKSREQDTSAPTPNESSNDSSSPTRSSLRDHFLTPLTDDSLQKYPPFNTSRHQSPAVLTPSVFTDTERTHVLDRFTKIFTAKIGDAISSGKLSQAWQRGSGGSRGSWLTTDYSKIYKTSTSNSSDSIVNARDYEAERDMIQPHLTPFIWGMTFSAVTLFSLRLGKWYQGRKMLLTNTTTTTGTIPPAKYNNVAMSEIKRDASRMQDLRHTRHDYSTYTTTNSNTTNNPFQASSSMQTIENLLSLPIDMALSLLIGISTTIYLTRPKVLLQDLSSSPLLSGKSVLSEELCKPFREEMETVNREFHTYNTNHGYKDESGQNVQKKGVISYSELWKEENLCEFDSLRAVRDFVANCRERDERIRRRSVEESGDDIFN
ncbi:hypothetical protein ACHAWO_000508 [Cyclotella atomus]|uniref:Uncharacterized protein n=1 Tax=Cyclotella atomus TaxID=382360 RepID=A0ABD3Q0J4_9STRA